MLTYHNHMKYNISSLFRFDSFNDNFLLKPYN